MNPITQLLRDRVAQAWAAERVDTAVEVVVGAIERAAISRRERRPLLLLEDCLYRYHRWHTLYVKGLAKEIAARVAKSPRLRRRLAREGRAEIRRSKAHLKVAERLADKVRALGHVPCLGCEIDIDAALQAALQQLGV